jgi:hypothetical protein
MANNFPNLKPALSLDMVNGIYVDSRVTFTRAGTRTYYGQEMVKAEENLLLQSQTFDNASWLKSDGAVVTPNVVSAPDGTLTADQIDFSATEVSRVQQPVTAATGDYRLSVYLRVAAGTEDVRLGSATTLDTVTLTTSWQRFVFSINTSNPNYTLRNSAGGGVKTIYAWGAQLEQRSSATAYTATTTQPITRYQRQLKTAAANEWPREFDPVTGECLGRSVWESRTNLVLRSEELDNASWTKANSTISANQIIAPDGALTVDKLLENTANSFHALTQNATVASGATVTASVYAKASELTFVVVVITDATAKNYAVLFNLATGVVVGNFTNMNSYAAPTSSSITSVGNGWYRCTVTTTLDAGRTTAGAGVFLNRSGAVGSGFSYTGDGVSGIYIWGAQLEAGAFATPYIPTVAAQVTRLADSAVMTGVNFSSWYRQDEGSFFSEALYNGIGNYVLFAKPANYPTDNAFIRTLANGNFAILVSGVAQANMTPTAPTTNTFAKVAGTYKTNDFAVSLNGATPVTDTSGITPNTLASLEIGSLANTLHINSYIKRITYYPQALTSANLQAITR